MENNIKGFKDLKVWQKAHQLGLDIIELVDGLPEKLIYHSIGNQLLRSATSIASNIAEGYGSFSRKEYRRYLGIALKSAYETENWLKLLAESKVFQRIITKEKIDNLEKVNIEIIKMLISLMNKLK
ncbi:MAG TPA: four helix bundle protein [candidate division Zixibacteria bacterium]